MPSPIETSGSRKEFMSTDYWNGKVVHDMTLSPEVFIDQCKVVSAEDEPKIKEMTDTFLQEREALLRDLLESGVSPEEAQELVSSFSLP